MQIAGIVSALILAALSATNAPAQSVISLRAGLINNPEGEVLLNGSKVQFEAAKFPQMKPGDVLSTGVGRVEVLLNPGSFVRLWEGSSMRLVSNSLTHPSYEVLAGSSVLEMASEDKNIPVDIAWKNVTVSPLKRGVFRLDTDPPVLRVFDGEALVQVAGRQVKVGRGKMLSLDGTWAIASFDRTQTNELDRWSAKRATYLAMVNMQTAYGAAGRRGSGGLWGWSSVFGIITYVPYSGTYNSFYGCRFYSPRSLAAHNRPSDQSSTSFDSGGGSSTSAPSYATNSATSGGTSGTIAASSPASTTQSSVSTAPISRDSGDASGRTR
jgi:hypothetical protein